MMDYRKNLIYIVAGLLALALAACGSLPATETPAVEETAVTDALADTQWTLVSMGAPGAASPVVAGSTITLAFETGNQAAGSGGCNSYGGAYQVEGGALSFSSVASTLMACADPAVNDQEGQYYQALQTAVKFELTGNQLVIWYDGGQKALTFVSDSATPAP
jgi:heat shock protein HslJ